MTAALDSLGSIPIQHLINTHGHFDRADGNKWLHSAGATIIAHENARKTAFFNGTVQNVGDERETDKSGRLVAG
jgi:glyoxylase-like metal-dependent hydrolase (beta-lactamase superfamily II)